ncbi:hypothetical protein AB0A81_39475 [Streptomyces flaveolus]|uniref:Uncharacterized protein n=1 Tax=Streptomyces flaveolus TaxID=67297 RepID=A0ABV1VU17_9ACTN
MTTMTLTRAAARVVDAVKAYGGGEPRARPGVGATVAARRPRGD